MTQRRKVVKVHFKVNGWALAKGRWNQNFGKCQNRIHTKQNLNSYLYLYLYFRQKGRWNQHFRKFQKKTWYLSSRPPGRCFEIFIICFNIKYNFGDVESEYDDTPESWENWLHLKFKVLSARRRDWKCRKCERREIPVLLFLFVHFEFLSWCCIEN